MSTHAITFVHTQFARAEKETWSSQGIERKDANWLSLRWRQSTSCMLHSYTFVVIYLLDNRPSCCATSPGFWEVFFFHEISLFQSDRNRITPALKEVITQMRRQCETFVRLFSRHHSFMLLFIQLSTLTLLS